MVTFAPEAPAGEMAWAPVDAGVLLALDARELLAEAGAEEMADDTEDAVAEVDTEDAAEDVGLEEELRLEAVLLAMALDWLLAAELLPGLLLPPPPPPPQAASRLAVANAMARRRCLAGRVLVCARDLVLVQGLGWFVFIMAFISTSGVSNLWAAREVLVLFNPMAAKGISCKK